MLKRIKVLLLDKFIFIAIAITIAIVCLSLFKLPSNAKSINNIDKVYHSIAYFSLAITWLISFQKKKNTKMLIVFACIFFGIIIEVIQSKFTNYRTGDSFDIIANSVGVLFALLFFKLVLKKKYIN